MRHLIHRTTFGRLNRAYISFMFHVSVESCAWKSNALEAHPYRHHMKNGLNLFVLMPIDSCTSKCEIYRRFTIPIIFHYIIFQWTFSLFLSIYLYVLLFHLIPRSLVRPYFEFVIHSNPFSLFPCIRI